MLVVDGSGCFGSIFLSLDTVGSWRSCISSWRALLREESCGRAFLILCGRASINDQSKYTTGLNGLLTFVFWHRALPSNFLDVSVCLTRAHIDWKEGKQVGLYRRRG